MSETGNAVRFAGRALLILAVPGLVAAAAEDPPQAPRLASYIQSNRIQFDTILGRIGLTTTRIGNSSSRSSSGTCQEQLSIRTYGDSAVVNYERSTPNEALSIKVSGNGHLHILRAPQGDSPLIQVEFVQEAGNPLLLKVGREKDLHVYEAPSLWHLLLEEPAIVQTRLIPLLRLLQPNTDLVGMANGIQQEMVRLAAVESLPDRKHWAELVRQLGDDSFTRRQRADRLLREAGQIAVAYLQNLDASELDAEQQFRIHRIIRSFTHRQEKDTPAVVARWLAADPRAWLVLLGREDESARRLAAERLRWLLGEPIAFDPGGDAATRRRQIEQLRNRIVPKAMAPPGKRG